MGSSSLGAEFFFCGGGGGGWDELVKARVG